MAKGIRYQLHGNGGQQVSWIDNTGDRPWSEIQQFGFNLLQDETRLPLNLKGSFLLSDQFKLNGKKTLTVGATIASAAFKTNIRYDVGFGVLLENGKAKTTLFARRPDGVDRFDDTGPLDNPFVAPTADFTQVDALPAMFLGGVDYYRGATFGPKSATYVTSKCKPDAGAYQLLFGMFSTGVVAGQPSALVIWPVDVS